MKRESVKLMSPVKERIEFMKRELNVKTESEAIAYLYLYYDRHFEEVTLKESTKLLQEVSKLHKSLTQLDIFNLVPENK